MTATRPFLLHPYSGSTTHFGFRTVPEESKEGLVRSVFDSVAFSYDLTNDSCRSAFFASGKTRSSPSFALTREGPYASLTLRSEWGHFHCAYSTIRAGCMETVRPARMWSTLTERCSRRAKNASKR
ncbi:hypothetical protein BJY52DRAFT_758020 [Lactarius psammicola]|nr:hypothetical protein BJY52DRAFT_758020 [Lactarius psammicola]